MNNNKRISIVCDEELWKRFQALTLAKGLKGLIMKHAINKICEVIELDNTKAISLLVSGKYKLKEELNESQ